MIPIFSPAKKARKLITAIVSLFTGKSYASEVWFAGASQSKGYFCKADTTRLSSETLPTLIDPTTNFLADESSSLKALEVTDTGTLISSPFDYGAGVSTFDRVSIYSYDPIYASLLPDANGGFLFTSLMQDGARKVLFSGGRLPNPTLAARAVGITYPSSEPVYTYTANFTSAHSFIRGTSIGAYWVLSFIDADMKRYSTLKGEAGFSTPLTGVSETFCNDGTFFYGNLNSSYPVDEEALLPIDAGKVVKLNSNGSVALTSAILADFVLLISDTKLEPFLNVVVLNSSGDGKYKNSAISVLQVRKSNLTVIRTLPVSCNIPYSGTIGADSYGYFSAGTKVLRIPPPPADYSILLHFDSYPLIDSANNISPIALEARLVNNITGMFNLCWDGDTGGSGLPITFTETPSLDILGQDFCFSARFSVQHTGSGAIHTILETPSLHLFIYYAEDNWFYIYFYYKLAGGNWIGTLLASYSYFDTINPFFQQVYFYYVERVAGTFNFYIANVSNGDTIANKILSLPTTNGAFANTTGSTWTISGNSGGLIDEFMFKIGSVDANGESTLPIPPSPYT